MNSVADKSEAASVTAKSKPFDLMNHKPALDFDTLNYVWDSLWRQNRASRATNQYTRAQKDEQESIMRELEELAKECATNQAYWLMELTKAESAVLA